MSLSSWRASAVQRVVHRREDLVDGDLVVVIGVSGCARHDRRIAEGDVHHREELVHRHLMVAVAVADTGGRSIEGTTVVTRLCPIAPFVRPTTGLDRNPLDLVDLSRLGKDAEAAQRGG